MARSRTYIPLSVYLNGRIVGTLSRTASGAIFYQYAISWLEEESAFPISLSLPLRDERYSGRSVNAVFDNLLPDSDAIRRRLAERTGASGADVYALLEAIGRDCVGALQFVPQDETLNFIGTIEAEPITPERIGQLLRELERSPLGVDTETDFRISLAGAQEKTALLFCEGQWHIPHGATATTHILKPPIGNRAGQDLSQSVENEYFCMQLLQAVGLEVANTAIETFDNRQVLVVERFDRRWTSDGRLLRLPQEDCCQALSVPSAKKYETDGGPGMLDILELLKGSDRPFDSQEAFLRAQIAFWLLGATDGHAKNVSLFLYPGGGFRLTPLYDVMSAQPLFAAGQIRRNALRLAMAVGSRRHYRIDGIMQRHFQQTADQAGISTGTVKRLLDEFNERIPGAIDHTCEALPEDFPEQVREPIVDGIKERLRRISSQSFQ